MASSSRSCVNLTSEEEISELYPIHTLVWFNKPDELNKYLFNTTEGLETKDPRQRTPLMLAVTLGYYDCAKILISHGANVLTETDGWSVVQEATSTGDAELVKLIVNSRRYQRAKIRFLGIPELLEKLKEAPDFYVEMKWEFSSWFPLVTRMCPNDTHRIYKQGSKVRIDSTLLGMNEYNKWLRGNTSMIFQAHNDCSTIIEIDHNRRNVVIAEKQFSPSYVTKQKATAESVHHRLTNPIFTSFANTSKINFERNKSGIWGWQRDKVEAVNGYNCNVYSANCVEIITRTRTEHMSKEDKDRIKNDNSFVQTLLGFREIFSDSEEATNTIDDPTGVSFQEYFTESFPLEGRAIGRPKELTTKIKKLKAQLWMCGEYPLSLQQQMMPIVNLMATSSSNFAKLKEFIEMHLPVGFPVKIEIPIFPGLTAYVTFQNIFASESPVTGVTTIEGGGECEMMCDIDESLFQPPAHYTVIDLRKDEMAEDDDDLLQLALQNGFLDPKMSPNSPNRQMDIWEALQYTATGPNEDGEMQRAIEASLRDTQYNGEEERVTSNDDEEELDDLDVDLLKAISLSEKEKLDYEREREMEDEMFKRVLEMSVLEK